MLTAITDSARFSALEFTNLYYLITSKLGLGENANGAIMVISVLLCMVIPYLLGSINPAIIFSKLFYHDDVRSHGSGNAGTTNILRTYGKKMAALTFVCDFLKAAISVGIGTLIFYKNVGGAIAGLFVILGHMFPVYYKFKGGKGVACSVAVVMILEPITFACLFVIFAIIVIGTKYVSLASCMAIGLFPVIVSAFENIYITAFGHDLGLIPAVAVIIALLVIFMHRANLKRLYEGKESKISLGKKKTDEQMREEAKKSKKAKKQTEDIPVDGKKYSDDDFVMCECGRVIPRIREKCLYCGKKNDFYSVAAENNEKGKNKKK